MESQTQAIVSAIKETTPQPTVNNTLGINWTPIVQGLISGVATSFGATVNFPQSTQTEVSAIQTPVQPSVDTTVISRIEKLESTLLNLTNTMSSLAETQKALTSTVNRIDKLESSLLQLAESQTKIVQALGQMLPSNKDNTNGEGGGTSSAPNSPLVSQQIVKKKSPLIEQTPVIERETKLPEIISIKSFDQGVDFEKEIVCADLEALISPEGLNQVYQAAWYNGNISRVFDISEFEYSIDRMLKAFWLNLIEMNKGKVCFFHNWGGYDSILSLPQLLASSPSYSFEPIFNNGQLMSIKVIQDGTGILTIKDSLKILPGSLSKLAKDWKVEEKERDREN
jgi:hypothetical protein